MCSMEPRVVFPASLRDTYHVDRLLGEGGFGRICLLFHKETNERYAVKIIRISLTVTAERAVKEATVLRHVDHPANILLTDAEISDATVKLADFGVSKIELLEPGSRTFVGTKNYMAPEILMNPGASYSNKVDIWSLGVLLHECLTGDRPKNIGENNRVVPDFTARMLSLDPEERMDIQEMLAQPWFEDEALKERVQSSLSQHTQACSLDVPREPRRCGNNEFYFVSPQLSSASVPQGYSGIREEDDDSWNGPLETGHSQHSDEDGTHSESDDGDTNYTSEETDDESIGSQTSEDCSGSSSSNNSSSSSSDGDDSDGSMTSDSDSSSDDSGSYNLQDKEKDNVHSTTDSFSDSSCLL